jgi:5-methylthioadenosine/S-adenosylhomocysteine deaminase
VSTPDLDRWPRAEDILVAATRGGARSVGIRDLGVIAPGRLADLVLIDANTVSFTPLNKLINHLVYCENGSSVRTVFVGGRIVVDEGRCTRFNEDDILAETRELGGRFLEQHLRTEAEHAVFEPYFREIWDRAFRAPLD